MKTIVLKINKKKPETKKLLLAVNELKKGNIIVFPTETVYGIGANAFNKKAVKKIFKVKGRPADNPLIVHIASKKQLNLIAKEIPIKAKNLIKKFWPGPLTLVLKKKALIPSIVTANLKTVAVRMPKHNVALKLIRLLKKPIAAPSANIAGKPSATNAKHALQDFKGKIPIIIDSGSSFYGIESTVIDATKEPFTLLRPGSLTIEKLFSVLKELRVHSSIKGIKAIKALSPGMKYRHYAPKADLILISGNKKERKKKINTLIKKFKKEKKRIGLLLIKKEKFNVESIKVLTSNERIAAKNLFKFLREFDEEKINVILAETLKEKGLSFAIMNRLLKASEFKVK